MSAVSPPNKFVQPSHLVVLGHPDPASFCAAVANTYCDAVRACGQQVALRDLYASAFNPLLSAEERPAGQEFVPAADIGDELELLRGADIITLVYPIWFGMPPAIIKGYVDRVLGAGFSTATIQQGGGHPLLAGKRLKLFTTSASTRPWLEEKGQWLALRQAFETYLQGIFGLVGAGHTHFDAIVSDMNERFAGECLEVVQEEARNLSAQVLGEKRAAQSHARRHGAGE